MRGNAKGNLLMSYDLFIRRSTTVERKATREYFSSDPRERTIVYEAPFDRCSREQDYATVWKEFEARGEGDPGLT